MLNKKKHRENLHMWYIGAFDGFHPKPKFYDSLNGYWWWLLE
jgi:hypothetical protein